MSVKKELKYFSQTEKKVVIVFSNQFKMHPVFENRKHAFILQERSLHILVSFRAQAVHPAQVGWLTNLHSLMEKYFRYIRF